MPHEITGLATTFNEALEKVEMARAREKEFALHAAHELRTPVAGILATLEQALHRPRDAEELKRRIGIAQEITSGMRVTLDSLMRLARLRGHLEMAAKMKFDPIASIREVIGACAPTISRRGLEMAESLPEGAGALDNDAGLFRVLVSNLIENAVEYSPRGSRVEITAALTPDRLTFSTANECGAMSDEEIQRLFQPFQRGATAAAETGDGHAGLGLSLAREAAHLLGGRMYAEKKGGGIVFTAELPR
jgi:signal transduction histidine kinase